MPKFKVREIYEKIVEKDNAAKEQWQKLSMTVEGAIGEYYSEFIWVASAKGCYDCYGPGRYYLSLVRKTCPEKNEYDVVKFHDHVTGHHDQIEHSLKYV